MNSFGLDIATDDQTSPQEVFDESIDDEREAFVDNNEQWKGRLEEVKTEPPIVNSGL